MAFKVILFYIVIEMGLFYRFLLKEKGSLLRQIVRKREKSIKSETNCINGILKMLLVVKTSSASATMR